MFREILLSTAVCVFLVILVSCSHGDPITNQYDNHSAQIFITPKEIYPAVGIDERAWDVDLASLVAGPDVPNYTPGDIWDFVNSIGQSCNYCAGVFLFTDDGLEAKPYCSWMSTVQGAVSEYPHVIAGSQFRADYTDSCTPIFDMPKCDSCLI